MLGIFCTPCSPNLFHGRCRNCPILPLQDTHGEARACNFQSETSAIFLTVLEGGRNLKLHEIRFFFGMYCEPTEMDYRIFQMNSYLPKSRSEKKRTLSLLTQLQNHGRFWWGKTSLVVVYLCISPFKFPHLSARCDSSANSTDTSILTESTLNPSSLFAYFISPALQKKL